MIGPGGKPACKYVLYGELYILSLLSTRLILKFFSAKIRLGSDSSFMPFLRRLRYNPAMVGISSSCKASASTIDAKMDTWTGERLISAARCLRSGVQKA